MNMDAPAAGAVDRSRPAPPRGRAAMKMAWESLLFAHWRIDAALLRPLVPAPLTIDTWGGSAWIGVIPFTMRGVRPTLLPPCPGTSAFHELNVRTYVHMSDGGGRPAIPGVWFFSLDAASKVAVRVARRSFGLPYMDASMSLRVQGDSVTYSSKRTHSGEPEATLEAMWTVGEPIARTAPPARGEGSLEYFLTERYCLYAPGKKPGGIARAWIHHEPWSLRKARLAKWSSTMVRALGLPEPEEAPHLMAADRVEVLAWKARAVGA